MSDYDDRLAAHLNCLPFRASLPQGMTLGQLADQVVREGVTYDVAKPQGIVDYWQEKGIDIRGQTVTSADGLILPLTVEMYRVFIENTKD